MRTYHYTLDLDGVLWHAGTAIDDPAILRLYTRSLEETSDGRFLFLCAGELNYIHPLDTPYVIHDIELAADPRGGITRATLCFRGGHREPLDPTTVEVGPGNVLYACVRDGRFRARFARNAYYRLAACVEERERGFVLVIDGRSHAIRGPRAGGSNSV